jgi:hypothetical protein
MKVKEKIQALWMQTAAMLLMAVFSVIPYSWAQAAQPQVAAGRYHTVGLKSNGTVVATGFNDYGQLDVGSWTGITQVAAEDDNTVGLKSDGTVVATGSNYGQCNTNQWNLGQNRPLTIIKAGTGTGLVTSNPPGINCGSDCSERYPEGVMATLTASATQGSCLENGAAADAREPGHVWSP